MMRLSRLSGPANLCVFLIALSAALVPSLARDAYQANAPQSNLRGYSAPVYAKDQRAVKEEAPSASPIPYPVRDSLHIMDISAVDEHLWLVTTQGAVLHSANDGLTWERQWPVDRGDSRTPAHRLTRVQFLDTAVGFLGGSDGAVLRTRDGGQTWQSGILPAGGDVRDLHFLDSLKGLVLESGNRAYLTTDGGRTWRLAESLSGLSLGTVGKVPMDGGIAYLYFAGLDGCVLGPGPESSSPARYWVPGRPALRTARFLDTSLGFAAGDRGILARTRDGGGTWDTLRLLTAGASVAGAGSRVADSTAKILALDFLNRRHGFAVGEKGLLFETRDGGRTWRKASRSLDQAGIGSYLRFPPPGYFLLLLVILLLVWPVIRSPRVEVVQESIADQLVSDRPLEDDRFDVLGLCRKADALAAFLGNPRTEPPLTFGIMGEWGRGKSSLMNLLRHRLGRDGFTTVWFNAWHHQSEESLLASLLETIRRTRIAPWWTLDGMRFRLQLSMRRALHGREGDWVLLLSSLVAFLVLCRWNPLGFQWSLEALGAYVDGIGEKGWLKKLTDGGALLVTMLPLGVTLLSFWRIVRKALVVFNAQPSRLLADLAGKTTLRDMSEKVGFREEFRREFSEVALALRHAPLVVFIDDLDRCRPEKVMEILESINFLVTCGPCYFVVAMDKRQITRAIIVNDERVIELFKDQGEAHAQEYLEKIINIEVPVPEPGPEAYQRLMTLQETPAKAADRDGDRRWQVVLKNLPLYLLVSFLVYLSGALLRAPSPAPLAAQSPDVAAKVGDTAAAYLADFPSAPSLEAALPFSWDPAGAPMFQSGNQAPWTRPFAVAVPALFGSLLAWAALAWYFQRRRRYFRDSADFLKAVDDWHPLIFLGAKTPRAVKKFLNRLRFFAVLRRNAQNTESEPGRMGDGELVALASLELGVRMMQDGQSVSVDNLRKFATFLQEIHPKSNLHIHIQTLISREDIIPMLKEFGSLGANVRVNS